MQTEKSQPEGKRVMPETRFTKIPALSVDPGLRFFGFADISLFFLTHDIKSYYLSFVISFIFDILRRTTGFSERHSDFFRGGG